MNPRKPGPIGTLSWATVVLCGACAGASPRAATPANGVAPPVARSSAGAPLAAVSSGARPASPARIEAVRDDLLDGSVDPAVSPPPEPGSIEPGDDGDVELVIDGDLVARCPALRLVRQHVQEFDADTVWVAALMSIAECMRPGGPMEGDMIAVSGAETYRHVVREVLRSRGISPLRVLSSPPGAAGVAECQAASPCARRVEISVASARELGQ